MKLPDNGLWAGASFAAVARDGEAFARARLANRAAGTRSQGACALQSDFAVTSRYDDRPLITIWETTQACDLACAHCRACARPWRDPRELDTAEAKALLDRLADAKVPLVVLTGGDPAKREDLVDLVAHGRSRGLHIGLTPSATPLVTRELLARLRAVDLSRLAVSLDGAEAASRDVLRGVAGSFEESLRILRDARELGLRTQVNTTLHAGNVTSLREIAQQVEQIGVVLWSVFLVVPTGRAGFCMVPPPDVVERALEELCTIAATAPFAVKTTEAPHYRRLAIQRGNRRSSGRGRMHVNDGNGFLFISHRGDIFPSGFLPVHCGNVLEDDPIEVYRSHPVFRSLRDSSLLEGRCGACEFRDVCGGSRSRAFAMTRRLLGEDPACAYDPGRSPAPLRRAS